MKITFSLAILICALIFTSQVFALPAFSLRNAIGLFQRETACIALSNCPGQKSNPPASAPKPSPSPPPPPPPEPSPEPSPTPSAEPPVEIQRAAMKIYTYSCTKEQKAAVQKAWDEAAVLADAHSKWESPGWFGWGEKYQAAMDMYLGADSRKDKPTFFGTGPLKSNVMRQRGIHYSDSSWSPRWSYGYFYCNEDAVPKLKDKPKPRVCSKARTTGRRVAVFTFADDGYIWNAKYVVLCPRFFEGDVTTLEAKVARAQRRPDLQRTMGDFWRRIKAGVIFHETYHWGKDEVSDPRCYLKEEIYNPERVVELALDKNVEIARLNGEMILIFHFLHFLALRNLLLLIHPFIHSSILLPFPSIRKTKRNIPPPLSASIFPY